LKLKKKWLAEYLLLVNYHRQRRWLVKGKYLFYIFWLSGKAASLKVRASPALTTTRGGGLQFSQFY
jgi:hypothetical protein